MTLLLLVNLGFGGGGGVVIPPGYAFTGDLTTVFSRYVEALHDAAVVASDTDTLIRDDVDEMIAATTDTHDRNTRYNEYLH